MPEGNFDWTTYSDRVNTTLVRMDEEQRSVFIAGLVTIFGFTEEEFFTIDLMGFQDGVHDLAFLRVVNDMVSQGIDIEGVA